MEQSPNTIPPPSHWLLNFPQRISFCSVLLTEIIIWMGTSGDSSRPSTAQITTDRASCPPPKLTVPYTSGCKANVPKQGSQEISGMLIFYYWPRKNSWKQDVQHTGVKLNPEGVIIRLETSTKKQPTSMSANCLMHPVIHSPPSFPHLFPPSPCSPPIWPSGGWGRGYRCFQPVSVLPAHDPNRLSKPSADRGMLTHSPSYREMLTDTFHPRSPAQLKSSLQHFALSRQSPVNCFTPLFHFHISHTNCIGL